MGKVFIPKRVNPSKETKKKLKEIAEKLKPFLEKPFSMFFKEDIMREDPRKKRV